ncbi:hypothetical protein AGLY_000316 [Aphis glycines]|uniref:BTB domain-containing protein n=1 Tax=Aphis glycines TaxID=307491 RepID=A0A6G0U6S3_APHGL|nr:hypothetical protein AGLY_000316 [Aphis glycines]
MENSTWESYDLNAQMALETFEMDKTVMDKLTSESYDQKDIMTFKKCEQKTYKNSSHMVGVLEVLQSLHKEKVLCDIRIETDDGTIIFGHKVVLISVSTYFREIFYGLNERNIDHINIKELDSTVLQLLINYIYTGEIIITESNVKVLLAAANLLQLDYVKNVCAEFLQTRLDASNCLGIKEFADSYDCMELSTSSQTYIKNQFLEVIDNDEFLSLSSLEVIKLISCNDLLVSQEEKVFECVIHWVKYELDSRKDFLPELMEHVRLPLISKQYLLEKVVDEPLLKFSPKCYGYIIEALQFHLQPFKISQTIRSTPRQSISFPKVILMLYWFQKKSSVIYWYDNIWQPAPTMSRRFKNGCLTVIKDQFVLAVGGFLFGSKRQLVEMLDVSSQSPCWMPMMNMLVSRKYFGVGSLDNCVYAIGGHDGSNRLNSVEMFDTNTNRWQMVSSMSTKRSSHGVGVLNNLLYVVGGFDGEEVLKSVECYDPCLDTWTLVATMSDYRCRCGVGVLDGILYAIGGYNISGCLKSVETYTPSSGVWTTIADMHFYRKCFGVVVLDGLLHVIGGCNNEGVVLNSIEIYNPKTNTWSLKTLSRNVGQVYSGVVYFHPKKEMDDTVMKNSTCELNDHEGVMTFKRCEQKTHKNSSHMVEVFEVLQSLRKDKVLCDIKIETDDGTIIFGHKIVLISVSKYFHEFFTDFNESNIDHINIKELDSTALQLLINYIYTGEIIITKDNVKVLLAAANFLQLDYVKSVCAEFLITQLDASNCLGIKAFADLYDCIELSTCSQTYIKHRFLEVVDNDEFLSLSSVEVIKLISCNDIFVPLEEKVFECVIHWLKHELDSRKDFLPELMEHVRLPLISKQYLLEKVVNEPLLKMNPKCIGYIFEALQFHLLKYLQPFTVSQTIQSTPRQSISFQKVILMLYWYQDKSSVIYWFDNIWQPAPTMSKCYKYGCLSVIKDQFVLAVGGVHLKSNRQLVEMLDVSSQSPCWMPMMNMLVSRKYFGVGSLDNCVYAIGGHDGSNRLNSVEMFDTNTNRWQMVSSMSTKRSSHGVGVLNNLLYVVGGFDGHTYLNSVECYDPSLDTWTPVAAMSECRRRCGIEVMKSVLYAIGGENNSNCLKSVETYTPSSGVWTTIADMHFYRKSFGVVVLDGLLHVIGGCNNEGVVLNSIEIYNRKTNTWSLKTLSKDVGQVYSGVVINKPPHFKIYND